uniref:(northern house mosquito) hypothetical protein n=1 Tax=Culex pipiens TaxID=7175 RepID=A0A8D8H4Q4_CULPI
MALFVLLFSVIPIVIVFFVCFSIQMCALLPKIAPVTFVFPKYKMRETPTPTPKEEGKTFPNTNANVYQCFCFSQKSVKQRRRRRNVWTTNNLQVKRKKKV